MSCSFRDLWNRLRGNEIERSRCSFRFPWIRIFSLSMRIFLKLERNAESEITQLRSGSQAAPGGDCLCRRPVRDARKISRPPWSRASLLPRNPRRNIGCNKAPFLQINSKVNCSYNGSFVPFHEWPDLIGAIQRKKNLNWSPDDDFIVFAIPLPAHGYISPANLIEMIFHSPRIYVRI